MFPIIKIRSNVLYILKSLLFKLENFNSFFSKEVFSEFLINLNKKILLIYFKDSHCCC